MNGRRLKSALMVASLAAIPNRSLFNLPRLVGVGTPGVVDRLASSAVSYRAEYPLTAPPALKTSIDGALAELARRVHE
jgi:hypothetical protein